MPSMNDVARMMAASEGTGMDAGPAEAQGGVEAMAPQDGADPIMDMTGALDMIESASLGLPPETQEKMRQHIEALRALTEEASAAVATQEPERMPAEPPAPSAGAGGGDVGMMA